MIGWLGRRLPKSLAGRFVLLLAAALIFANAVALALLNSERSRFAREARRGVQVERVAALLPALSQIPPELRHDVARAASTRSMRLSVDPQPAVAANEGDWLAVALAKRLQPETDGDVRVAIRDNGHPPHRGWGARRHRPARMDVSVELPGGMWLNARQRGLERRQPLVSGAVLFALLLSLMAVLLVGIVFIRRITRPLSALAKAAARAGEGDRGARVPEVGARELKSAAAAFNAMQGRIEAFEAERARTVAAVGHDLRTPITSLRIRAEMLDDDIRTPMVRTLDEMRVMADGLLAWGRTEADAEPRRPLNLSALLRDLCADDESGAVRFDGPPAVAILGRKVALTRAFGNIVGNARRYAGSAVVHLTVGAETVVVTVTDDGPGIPEAALTSVLEPFTRLDASRSSETGGAGLGLSIARTIIGAHGGTLILSNREDRSGLVVRITLPTASPRKDAPPAGIA